MIKLLMIATFLFFVGCDGADIIVKAPDEYVEFKLQPIATPTPAVCIPENHVCLEEYTPICHCENEECCNVCLLEEGSVVFHINHGDTAGECEEVIEDEIEAD